jgi:hypothetical protein
MFKETTVRDMARDAAEELNFHEAITQSYLAYGAGRVCQHSFSCSYRDCILSLSDVCMYVCMYMVVFAIVV